MVSNKFSDNLNSATDKKHTERPRRQARRQSPPPFRDPNRDGPVRRNRCNKSHCPGPTGAPLSASLLHRRAASCASALIFCLTKVWKLLKCTCNSWSVVFCGTRSPLRLPVVKRPMMRQPLIDVCTIGIVSASSASNVLFKKRWIKFQIITKYL